MKTINQRQLLELLRKRQGKRTAKEFAAEIGVSPQYLSDVYAERREVGPAILDALKIRKQVVYYEERTA